MKTKIVETNNIIVGARPSWSCTDEIRVIELALQNQDLRTALKKRKIYSSTSLNGKRLITDNDIDNNIRFDVSIDGSCC